MSDEMWWYLGIVGGFFFWGYHLSVLIRFDSSPERWPALKYVYKFGMPVLAVWYIWAAPSSSSFPAFPMYLLLLFITIFIFVMKFLNDVVEKPKAEAEAKVEEDAKLERERKRRLRDGDTQDVPVRYDVGRHANQTLALRYGVANCKGPKTAMKGNYSIRIRKKARVGENKYLVELSDFGKKETIAVAEPGTPYIKTFLPIDESWFEEYKPLEQLLKDNPSFSILEIANFHAQAIIRKL